MFHSRYDVPFFESFIVWSVKYFFCEILFIRLICPKDILQIALCFLNTHFSKIQSGFFFNEFHSTVDYSCVFIHLVHCHSKGDRWCDRTLECLDLGVRACISLEVFFGFWSSIHMVCSASVDFPLVPMSRECHVSYTS